MMVANRLKDLAQLTRGAVRDVRQIVQELADVFGPTTERQPSLVRVPVRNSRASGPRLRSPFTSASRSFSTTTAFRASSSTFNYTSRLNPRFVRAVKPNLAGNLWPYSAFRRPMVGRGPLPSGLYRNFVNLNARNFTTYGGSASREAVQNLTASLRCMFDKGGDTLLGMKMGSKPSQNLSYHGCSSQNEAPHTFELARNESTGVEALGSFVEFSLPKMELTLPTISFMNSEILSSIEEDFAKIKDQIDITTKNIELIFDAYGSLPMERKERSVRIHFPNLEAHELEQFLIELGINEGLVYTNEEVEEMIAQSERSNSLMSMDELTDFMDQAPGLVSTNSNDSQSVSGTEDSLNSQDFFAVLSSSGDLRTLSQLEQPIEQSPVVIAHSDSFSEVRSF